MAASASYSFGCTHCQKSFDSRGKLNRHLRTHTKPFRCSVCDRGFALRVDLQRHVKARHRLAQETYPCRMPGCSFKAARKDNLRQHEDRSHGRLSESKPSESAKKVVTKLSVDSTEIIITNTISTEEVELSKRWDHRALLFRAAAAGNATVLQASLDEGIDVNVRADDGSTALHCAARTGQAEMVTHLIQQGADTENSNRKWRKPLHEAILGRDVQTVKALLYVSPSFEIDNIAALCIARSESVEILEHCIEHLGAAISGADKYAMLLAAAKHGQTSMVATLLLLTEDIVENSSFDSDRQLAGRNLPWARQPAQKSKLSPLDFAARRGDLEMTQLLVKHGFKVNGPACVVRTPLHMAASNGHISTWEYLLSHKDIQVNRKPGNSPLDDLLHIVVARGDMEMLESLLSREDIVVNCRISDEWWGDKRTPLHLAVMSGRLPVLQLLLMDGRVDRNAESYFKFTALQLSALYGHWDIVQTLLDHDKLETAPKSGAQTQEEDPLIPSQLMERLLNHPDFQNVNIRGSRYDDKEAQVGGLLHIAVKQGDCDMLRLLLNRGYIDVNLESGYSEKTALHLAAELGRTDLARLLLRHKDINVDLRLGPFRADIHGTALQIATKQGHTDLVELLLAYGATQYEKDASAPSKNGDNEVISNATVQQGDSVIYSQLEMEEYSFLDEYMQDSSECMLDADDIPATGSKSWLDTVLGGDGTA
ncbi:ankyrin repeat-containing domain protein [Paraphoma chrysanthemicola]|nr:ankyrin repeat-containing domain protein [Paraphoma chrysanthemicola]